MPSSALRLATSAARRGAFDRMATCLPALRRCFRQSIAPGKAATPSCSTPHKSRMKPSYNSASSDNPETSGISEELMHHGGEGDVGW